MRAFRLRTYALSNRPVQANVGKLIKLHPWGATAFDCWSGQRFERSELQTALTMLEPGMTFLDIGSNAGLYALSATTLIQDLQAFAFEPCKSTFRLLQKNIALNAVDVNAVCCALGERRGMVTMSENVAGRDGLNTVGSPSHPDSRVVRTRTVEMMTLDDFLEERGVSRVGFMKVDVEGGEFFVFQGARKLLQRDDAPVILFENYSWCTRGFGYHPIENVWLLESWGYTVYALDSKTGTICDYPSFGDYDAMAIALKPCHRIPGDQRINARVKL